MTCTGRAPGHGGAAPGANIVLLDVFDDFGASTVGNVMAAAEWIDRNKDAYGICVANFSLTGSADSKPFGGPPIEGLESGSPFGGRPGAQHPPTLILELRFLRLWEV